MRAGRCGRGNLRTAFIAARVSGTAIAVSFDSAAAENHSAAAHGLAVAARAAHTPAPTACMPRQKCPHAPACSAQTRWDRAPVSTTVQKATAAEPASRMRQPPHRQQPQRRHHQHRLARHLGIEARSLPPQRQVNAGQRRMRVGQRGERNQRAGAEEVPCRGNVVAGLVPVVGQAQQREVAQRRAPQR